MPYVILRGSKQRGQRVSRLVLEGSSSNPARYIDLNGDPFEVTDEELAALGERYVLEPSEAKPPDAGGADRRMVSPDPPDGAMDSDEPPPAVLVGSGNQDDDS
jgi:hypothetical protein